MTGKTYKTPNAFRTAIDHRLRQETKAGYDLNRQRQLLIFDRFLARVVLELCDAVVLKGGLALELRLRQARTTKDIDIWSSVDPSQLLLRLQRAGRADLGDFMKFEVGPHKHPTIQGDGIKVDGVRFRVECKLAGKTYGGMFGLDVSIGEPMFGEPEEMLAVDWLGFAGVSPPRLRLYPIETHLAEKLHAYTLPRRRINSRVKDLPDIVLLAQGCRVSALRSYRAIEQTFEFRNTHAIPDRLTSPPASWQGPYAAMAEELGLSWETLDACYDHAGRFLNPVLAGERVATWDPDAWVWR